MGSTGGWNRPAANQPTVKKGGAKKPAAWRGLVAGLVVVCALGGLCLWMLSGGDDAPKSKPDKERGRIKTVMPAKCAENNKVDERKARSKRVRAELNEKVRDFVRRAPTNNVEFALPPLDPKDPDNILRTQLVKEISALMSIRPGDPVPKCLPFTFLYDDGEETDNPGIRVYDGGNKKFLDEIKRWKVTLKEGDGEKTIETKQKILDAQLELMQGIDEGITVNDSLRAAYDFRVRAAEARSEMVKMLRELHAEEGSTQKDTRVLIEHANEKLRADGIKEITPDDVFDEEDEPETQSEVEEK